MKSKLDLTLGHVKLNVANLSNEKRFYVEVIGLEILKEEESEVTLGKESKKLLTLYSGAHLLAPNKNDAGLYHFAILFESRGDLARTLHSVLDKRPDLFTGSADHLVSEAFYLNDPEGNGIELYFDRDKSLWNWENSKVQMASIYLNPEEYLTSHVVLEESRKSMSMGHFHLKVGNIEDARRFYVDILGFEITASYPGALFISVNGYHHHLGLNTWDSEGSRLRRETLGLHSIEFVLPSLDSLRQIRESLQANDISYHEDQSKMTFADPWGNQIVMVTHA